MKNLFRAFLVLSSLNTGVAAENTALVIGSVSEVCVARPQQSRFVEVIFRIHSPSNLSGATLVLITDTADRAFIRSQMPKGSLYKITLPNSVILDLKKQRARQERIDKDIDLGTLPEINSAVVVFPQVRITDLPVPLEPLMLKP